MVSWAENTIWWSVYPLGALGAPIHHSTERALAHRLTGLTDWLDYLIGLGANGLSLGPIWDSTSHGYDVLNHLAIDPRLGDEADFTALVEACHNRGIRVMLDGVFNHVSWAHPAFQKALTSGQDSPNRALFARDSHQADGFARFEGHGELVTLDHSNPSVWNLTVRIMNYWLDRGADGWRLDAAYAIDPQFWKVVLPQVREAHPEVYILGEVLHGEYAEIVADTGLDSVTQYELWKALWSSIRDSNPHELAWALQRHNQMLDHFVPYTFISNHDVTRIASQVGLSGALVAAGLLYALGGTPSIYYGEEQGWTGVKEDRVGGDDAIRGPLPQFPQTSDVYGVYRHLIAMRRTHPWLVHARTEPGDLEYRTFSFRSVGPQPGQVLDIDLTLEDQPHLRITDHGEELLHL
jgi:glycosidase